MDFMTKFIDYLKSIDLKLLPVLLIVMLLDIISGTIGALLKKDFKSTIFREGLFKKLLELVLVVVGYLLDYTLSVQYIGQACMILVIGMEAYSVVIENMSGYIDIPQWLKDILEQLKSGEVKNNDN